ncbi:MAG TPA: O-antigen ligase family protein [Methylomirabilota bacterium]|nr:O-antigen ligase family protein [Methylomirabilota bacterium]
MALLLVALAAAAWLAGELAHGALTWRRTPLDLPLALLAGYVLLQLALGNRALVAWALAPPAPATDVLARFPAPLFTVGTVTPRQTLDSLLIFAGYAAVYLLVVQLVRTRRQLGRLVRVVLMAGGLMAFLALVDYMTGEAWLLAWLRDHPFGGRASGTFVNPDHFAAWLTMLIPLGLGWVTARAGDGRHAPSVRATMSIRALREQAIRRYLPLVGVVVMALALVMTLSRGGIVGLAVGLLALLALLGATGRARRSVLLTGALLVAVAGYGGWIGFGPLLARFSQSQAHGFDRLTQYLASLPMLRDFPIFGAGLGAYRDVYFRYQPLALKPDEVYYPYAHNDLLQLLTELGPPGALLCLFVGWRIVGDLVGPHLLGRGACPVDGGAGEEARRNDRYSVAIAVGALAGVAALVTHSTLDFSARIAANGVLAAVLLGIATVTLHTRLIADQEQLLSAAPALPLARRRGSAIAIGAVAAVLLAGWSAYWVHIGRLRAAEDALRAAPPADKAARAEAVLAVDRRSVAGLRARAAARQTAALAAWMAAPAPGVDRRAAAIAHVAGGRADLRAALAVSPTVPQLHLDLAWLEATEAVLDDRAGPEGLAASLAHAGRAAALAPEDATIYAAIARIAYTAPEIGFKAAAEAVRRQPALLAGLVAVYGRLGLDDTEWLAIVPATVADRLELAALLEARPFTADRSLAAYRAAVEVAPPAQAPFARWVLAGALARRGDDRAAIAQLEQALAAQPGSAELERALGEALARRGEPSALDHFRAGLAAIERRSAAVDHRPFDLRDARLVAWLREHGGADLDSVTRYRRALARYLSERRLWDQAIAEWQQLVQTAPKDAEARFALGAALDAAGAGDRAIEEYRAAVTLDPRATRYRARLAARLWETDQYYQAINEWRVVVEQAPADVDARMAFGRALEKIGEREEAYRQYRAVLDARPGHPAAIQALARFR